MYEPAFSFHFFYLSNLTFDLSHYCSRRRIVLGLCDQGSLQAAIDEGAYRCSGNSFEGHPDMGRVLATATEIASAMAYLHSKARARCRRRDPSDLFLDADLYQMPYVGEPPEKGGIILKAALRGTATACCCRPPPPGPTRPERGEVRWGRLRLTQAAESWRRAAPATAPGQRMPRTGRHETGWRRCGVTSAA